MEEDDIPLALKSIHSLREPNQSIQLYEGTLKVLQGGDSRQGNGTIYLKWFPFPQIEFQLTCDKSLYLRGAETTLKFPEIDSPVKTLISVSDRSSSTEREIHITGRIREPIVIGLGRLLTYIQFHLTNFEDFFGTAPALIEDNGGVFIAQRATLEAGDWKITIDQLKTTTSNIKVLKAQGGYAITHVGKLEKISGEVFTTNEGHVALRALSDFLSFIKGLRVIPILLVGYNSENDLIWQEWSEAKTASSWQNVNSWAWGVNATNFVKAFPGFWSWWHTWSESARRIIYWYVECNTQAGAIEGSCVLEQATLELIAWMYLEADFKSNQKQFKHPSQKLNHLLFKLDIPQEIPSDLTKLASLARQRIWDDNGALIFVKVRNNITHSDPGNQDRLRDISVDARIEAWELGLWYLELILLRLFDYQGVYFNRLRRGVRYFGDLDLVPWLISRVEQYIQVAMRHATYTSLEDGSFSGEIFEFANLQVNAETEEACQQKLEKMLKESIIVGLSQGSSLPIMNGINLNHKEENTEEDIV